MPILANGDGSGADVAESYSQTRVTNVPCAGVTCVGGIARTATNRTATPLDRMFRKIPGAHPVPVDSGSPARHPIPRNTRSQAPLMSRIIMLETLGEILDHEPLHKMLGGVCFNPF